MPSVSVTLPNPSRTILTSQSSVQERGLQNIFIIARYDLRCNHYKKYAN